MSGANVLGDGAAGGMNAAGAPPGFDLNDFPSLGGQGMQGRGGMGGGGFAGGGMAGVGAISHGGFGMGGMGMAQSGAQIAGGGLFGGMDGMGSADGYGVLGGVLQKPHPEFTMQNEDFPALGGGGPGGGGGATGGQGNAPGKNLASSLQSANFPPMGSGGGGRGTLGGVMGGSLPWARRTADPSRKKEGPPRLGLHTRDRKRAALGTAAAVTIRSVSAPGLPCLGKRVERPPPRVRTWTGSVC